tara:strand:- start:522 stop:875 length:354 start_codon:yes stop_codon:yes gene_type:complete
MSIFSQLPHDLIFRIIKESQTKSCLEYHQREKSKEYISHTNNIISHLKQHITIVNELMEYNGEYVYKVLLPRWAQPNDYSDKIKKPQMWCRPYSTSLLESAMSENYWVMKQKNSDYY